MKKKPQALLMAVLILLPLALCACGRSETSLLYSTTMDSVEETRVIGVRKYGSRNELTVPRRHAGKPVTVVFVEAFRGQPIERVTLTDITRIDSRAFMGSYLQQIELGKTEDIGSEAFSYCRMLESIRIPASVQQIGVCAFANCRRLTRVCFEGNPDHLEPGLFLGCSPLLIVTGPAGGSVEAYCRENRIMFLPSASQ